MVTLIGLVDRFKLVDFHIECFLILANVLHLANELETFFLVVLDLLEHHFDALLFFHVLLESDLVKELICRSQ